MQFEYNSVSRGGIRRVLKQPVVDDVRDYLLDNTTPDMTLGELQNVFLEYRTPSGSRLMINQLEPMFTWCALWGRVWS